MRNANSQLPLPFRPWGGRRVGAGRKPTGSRAGVPHRARAKLSKHTPVHVTVKLERGLPSLRAQFVSSRVRRLLIRAQGEQFRVVHWSLQTDHVHLIVEAQNKHALSRSMAKLNTGLAKLLNRIALRRGPVLRERYHDRQLRTPRETHHTLRYVLNNAHKHRVLMAGLDPLSSAPMFDGWSQADHPPAPPDGSARPPQTWLLRIGWRRHGLISVPSNNASDPRQHI
jgi:REP element-mobilizing transposase RayT